MNNSTFEDRQGLDGELLENYVRNKDILDVHEIYKITLNLCNIVEDFHKGDFFIICRELNPRNIIIMKNKEVRLVEKSSYLHMFHSKNASLKNYRLWEISKQNDLRSIGFAMYFMATGKLPYTVLDILIDDNYPENINKNLKDIIYRCFEGNYKNAYSSVGELSKEISMEILKYIKYKDDIYSKDLKVQMESTRQRRIKIKASKVMNFNKGLVYFKYFMRRIRIKSIPEL